MVMPDHLICLLRNLYVSQEATDRTRQGTTDQFKLAKGVLTRRLHQFSSVAQSCVQLFVTPWTAACQASLSINNSQSLLKRLSIESVMPSNHLILCRPLFLLPSVFPSIRVFSSELVLRVRGSKYWSFSFSISPSNEYARLISFKIDWFDLLVVQGTLKCLLQHHSSKASILWRSAFSWPNSHIHTQLLEKP